MFRNIPASVAQHNVDSNGQVNGESSDVAVVHRSPRTGAYASAVRDRNAPSMVTNRPKQSQDNPHEDCPKMCYINQ